MDDENKKIDKEVESKTTVKRNEYKDGSFEEISVENVEGGFIKTVNKRYKNSDGDWKYDAKKSIHQDNPLEENKTVAEKLAEVMHINV